MDRSTAVMIGLIVIVGSVGAFSLANTTPTSGTVPIETQSGVTVLVENTGGEMNLKDPWTSSNQVNVTTAAGNATVSGAGEANITLKQTVGTNTNITNADVEQNSVEVNPEDKPAVVVGGGLDQLNYTDTVAVDDGSVDFGYGGSGPESEVKLTHAPANTQMGAIDANSGKVLDVATSDANGNVTFTLQNSQHNVKLQTGTEAPTVSNESPTGNLTDNPGQLSIRADDGDMAGDNLTATFELDGNQVGTDSRSDNGTLSTSISNVVGGDHTVDVTVEDAYGNTETISYLFRVPATVTVRNETNASETLDGVSAEIRFENSDQVVTRATNSSGQFDLEGLPVGQPYFVTLENNNYTDRQVAITDIYSQQNLYMLNTTKQRVNVRFTINDRTGRYEPDRSIIILERPITRDFDGDGTDETRTERIASDSSGVQGTLFTIQDNTRYRLAVRNSQGDVRQLGTYETVQNETVKLEIGDLSVDVGGDDTYGVSSSFENESSPTIKYQFSDPANDTRNLDVKIYERGNESNVTFEKTYDGPLGNISLNHGLNAQEDGKTWVIEWSANRNGEEISGSNLVGPRVTFGIPLSPLLKSTLSVGLIIIIGGLFGGLKAEVGAIVISLMAGGFWLIQWLPPGIGVGAILLALAIAVIGRINSQPEVV